MKQRKQRMIIRTVLVLWVMAVAIPMVCGAALKASKAEAGHVLDRTAAVVATAQQCAAQGRKYEGLGLAVAHQLWARRLFDQGDWTMSIFHSLRSRILAARVITANQSDLLNEALYDQQEQKFAQAIPNGRELDQKLREAKIEIPNDSAAVGIQVR